MRGAPIYSKWRLALAAGCALAALSAPALAQEERIGRMFFTPAQRLSLDMARNQRARTAVGTERTEQDAPVAQTITYGGMVRRNDGKTTVWLNNQPVHDREAVGGANIVGRVRPDGSVTLQNPQSGRSVTLKPGQSVELLTGTVEESYTRRPPSAPASKPGAKAPADAKGVAAASAEQRAREEREREDRQQQVIERALQESAAARSAAPPAAPAPASPTR